MNGRIKVFKINNPIALILALPLLLFAFAILGLFFAGAWLFSGRRLAGASRESFEPKKTNKLSPTNVIDAEYRTL